LSSEKEKFLNEMNLNGDARVKSHVHVWYQVWEKYGDQLKHLAELSPHVSVGIDQKSGREAGSRREDIWGCEWLYPIESHDGLCVKHPITSLDELDSYQPPNPEKFTDWAKTKENIEAAKAQGKVTMAEQIMALSFLGLPICGDSKT